MGLKERIQDELTKAQKQRDPGRVSTFRLLKSAIRYEEDAKRHDLSEDEIVLVVSRLIKQRKESIEFFKQGKRQDLVDKEENELKILQEFLPPGLSESDLRQLVDEAVMESGAVNIKDMGKVMKILMLKTKGRAEGEIVKNLVTDRLIKGN
ncbi:MAG TPA: GatB/YqeY domain-containing protein [bacterium]